MKFLVSRGRFRNSEFDLWTPRIFRRDFELVGLIVVIVLVMLVIVFVIIDFETRIVSLNSRPGPPFRSSRGPLSGRSEKRPKSAPGLPEAETAPNRSLFKRALLLSSSREGLNSRALAKCPFTFRLESSSSLGLELLSSLEMR